MPLDFKSSIFVRYMKAIYNMNSNSTNKVHKTLIHSIFNVFVMVKEDVDNMALEMCLKTATGEWLDLWGSYFGIPRISPNETDEVYSDRIIEKIISPKATIPALKKSTSKWLYYNYGSEYKPEDIEITEPWKSLFITSQRGTISHFGRLPDSEYWTPGIIDIAIPDASEMSKDLILYLNTIKAAGVQISWHTTMSWKVVTGLFNTDSVKTSHQMYIDLYIKRASDLLDAFRTKSEYDKWETKKSALSVSGYISGSASNRFEVAEYRDFKAVRVPNHPNSKSDLIKISDLCSFVSKTMEDATVEEVTDYELNSDRNLPNISECTGRYLQGDLKPYLAKNVEDIIEDFGKSTVEDIIEKKETVINMADRYKENTSMLEYIKYKWNKLDYLNKKVNTNLISICTGPIQILTVIER